MKRITIMHALMTEKCMAISENENKLVFRVHIDSNKNEIREAVTKQFKVKVVSVQTMITPLGAKRAFVKLAKEHNAGDIVANMGVL
jgi:large subunit ribosomal protein L23